MTEQKPKRPYVRNEARERKSVEYKKQNMKQLNFRLHNRSDAELISVYEQIPDKAEFLRNALRRYAEEHNIKPDGE